MTSLRGIFNNVMPTQLTNREKIMSVILLKSKCISFDLIFYDDSYNKQVRNIIKGLEFEYTNYSDRKTIYYICVRNKAEIRKISRNSKLIIDFYNDEYHILKSVKIRIDNIIKCFEINCNSKIIECDKNKIVLSGETNYTLYVHDIIDTLNIETGFYSKILYIGLTDFPLDRPFDKPHKGMMRAIYNYKNKGNDIFIYYNLFQIRYMMIGSADINFIVSNSLVEILDKGKEARFIETALIKYFLSENYSNNYKNEMGELKNLLQYLTENNISKIYFELAFDSEYSFYKYYSAIRKVRNEHNFVINSENASITLCEK